MSNRIPQHHIPDIDSGMYFIAQYHPGLRTINGTLNNVLFILYTYERMSMLFSRPPVVSISHQRNLSQHIYARPCVKSLRMKSSRVNHAKTIAASSAPPLFLLAASPAPATVEHSIVATCVQIVIRSWLRM